MKKVMTMVLIFTLLLSIILILPGCDKDEEVKEMYTVSVYLGLVPTFYICDFEVEEGDVIGKLSSRLGRSDWKDQDGYTWYTDKNGNNKWDLYKDEVRSDLTLYGKRE